MSSWGPAAVRDLQLLDSLGQLASGIAPDVDIRRILFAEILDERLVCVVPVLGLQGEIST